MLSQFKHRKGRRGLVDDHPCTRNGSRDGGRKYDKHDRYDHRQSLSSSRNSRNLRTISPERGERTDRTDRSSRGGRSMDDSDLVLVARPTTTNHARKRMYLPKSVMEAIYRKIKRFPLPASLTNISIDLINDADKLFSTADASFPSNSWGNGSNEDNDSNNGNDGNDSNDILEVYDGYNGNYGISSAIQGLDGMHLTGLTQLTGLTERTLLTSTEKRARDVKQFKETLHTLTATGNNTRMNSWEEVERALGRLFSFGSLIQKTVELEVNEVNELNVVTQEDEEGDEEDEVEVIEPPSKAASQDKQEEDNNENQSATANQFCPSFLSQKLPSFSLKKNKKKQQHSTPAGKSPLKSPIKAAQSLKTQRKHHLSAISTIPSLSSLSKLSHFRPPKSLSITEYRKHIERRMGPNKYVQIFHHAQLKETSELSELRRIKELDERIRRKEESLTHPLVSSNKHDVILLRRQREREEQERKEKERKEKEDKERQEREAKESASNLLRPLTPTEQSLVQSALYSLGPPTDVLASLDADFVQRGSMQRLQPGTWVNDEIINYFLKNCLAKRDEKLCASQPGRRRSHFFNSFFMQSLFDEKNIDPTKRGRYNYNNVKRWSKKVPGKDVFALKYIVCPINLDNMHWTCAVMFMEEKKICYFDSLGGTDGEKLKGLLEYLKDEHRSKKGREMEGWEEWELLGCDARVVPQQKNGYDCGVFTCMFCDFVSKDCPLLFSQKHVNQCRERIALSIMKNCAIE